MINFSKIKSAKSAKSVREIPTACTKKFPAKMINFSKIKI